MMGTTHTKLNPLQYCKMLPCTKCKQWHRLFYFFRFLGDCEFRQNRQEGVGQSDGFVPGALQEAGQRMTSWVTALG